MLLVETHSMLCLLEYIFSLKPRAVVRLVMMTASRRSGGAVVVHIADAATAVVVVFVLVVARDMMHGRFWDDLGTRRIGPVRAGSL